MSECGPLGEEKRGEETTGDDKRREERKRTCPRHAGPPSRRLGAKCSFGSHAGGGSRGCLLTSVCVDL